MHILTQFLPFVTQYSDLGDLIDMARYFAIVITDGDWLNDWLTHLPTELAPHVIEVGKFIAGILF